jgi:hypothetical protein
MTLLKMSKDTEPLPALGEPSDDPPTYTSSEVTPNIAKLQEILIRVLPLAIAPNWKTGQLEDARRNLALLFPTTDLPHQTRLAEANQWILECNNWLVDMKRSYGCATHDLVIPPLPDLEDSPRHFDGETVTSAERKQAAAIAVHRATESVAKDLDRILGTVANSAYAEASIKRYMAQVFLCTSDYLTNLYIHVSLRVSQRNHNHKLDQEWIALGFVWHSARVVTGASMCVVCYQLEIARYSNQIDATTALAKAVRAFAVCLTAMQIWEATDKTAHRYYHRQYPFRSRLRNVRIWLAQVTCRKSRSSKV